MSLFLNTSNLYNRYQDCCYIDVCETIERDCLSVLHKLHDQVNGLQLVQVVVQPLAKLFNPASLATLAASSNSSPSSAISTANTSSTNQSNESSRSTIQQNTTASTFHGTSASNPQHDHDVGPTPSNNPSVPSSHSRTASSTSGFNTSGSTNNSSIISSSSTYMMSPDTAQALIARLDSDRDVNWLMEIIGYGLSMPFSLTEQDSVKDCCTIYCEWLISALLPYDENNDDSKYQQLSKLVPVPIRQDPNRYARKMLSHLYNIFLPRQMTINPSLMNHNPKEQSDAIMTAVSRQAVLCHRVLRTIENIAQNQSNLMDDETWNHLLALLLAVNDKLLSAPTEPDDIGTQLHDRILGVLFELMLLASPRSILTPSLWRTFHEMCQHWRHRPALVDHWRRITLLLTKKLTSSMSNQGTTLTNRHEVGGFAFDQTNPLDMAVNSMSADTLSQTWFRFLKLIGNPVDLADPNTISKTDEFYHSACASDNVLDPRQHPCLSSLPQIFVNAMGSIREFIETFLGYYMIPDKPSGDTPVYEKSASYQSGRLSIISLSSNQTGSTTIQSNYNQNSQFSQQAVTPTQSRKTSGIKSIALKGSKVMPFSSTSGSQPTVSPGQETIQPSNNQSRPSLMSLSSRAGSSFTQSQFWLHSDRPKCNSLLHVFGDWLFSASLLGSDLNQEIIDPNDGNTSEGAASFVSSTTTEIIGSRAHSPSQSSRRDSNQKSSSPSMRSFNQSTNTGTALPDKIASDTPLSIDSFEAGQAEAIATLCKLFAAKTSSEDIIPSYLSRFYLCLQHCLSFGTGQDPRQSDAYGALKRQLLAGVLVNSTNLLQKDLDGFNLLIPSFIKAIEFVFDCNEREIPIQPPPRQHNRSSSFRHGFSNQPININNCELRKACILNLANLLAYPLHFQSLPIRNCLNESSPTITFASLRPRLLKLLFVALQTEKDPTNMQILFGGLSLAIHDLAKLPKSVPKNVKNQQDNPNSSTILGNDGSYLSDRQDDSSSQNSFVFNSNSGFLVKALHVTCHLLINIWKHDTQVSLVALELLTTIARISTSPGVVDDDDDFNSKSTRINNNNDRIEMRNEYKQTTKWICDYICNQCSRPPPAHSRDMHSTIVAAYQCLSVWFYNHPYLLDDESCVNTVMEVIELGVSGQKSKSMIVNPNTGITTQIATTKEKKIMKPSSMRVRDAAESLLNICMVRTSIANQYPGSTMSSFDTVLDESYLAEMFGGNQYRSNIKQIQDAELRQMEAYKCFKYFSDEDAIIFALLETPYHDSPSKDSVICLLRTPFGRHCWKLKFNLFNDKTCDKILVNKTVGLMKRPFQQCTTPTSEIRLFPFNGPTRSLYTNNSAKFFPETAENIESNNLDQFVTTLDNYTNSRDPRLKNDLQKIAMIMSHQVLAEQKVMSESLTRIKKVDCEEPQASNDLEVARILATHLGLKSCLSLSSNKGGISSNLIDDLRSLDQHSVRICDSVSIFYVRRGRTNAKDILESVRARHNVSLEFFEWLLELGQPTVVKNHNRWTGKIANSWTNRYTLNFGVDDNLQNDVILSRNQMLTSDHGGGIFDGDRMTLYWSDMCQELAFLVPHKIERFNNNDSQISSNRLKLDLKCSSNLSDTPPRSPTSMTSSKPNRSVSQTNSNIDPNSDSQSICSIASDASSISARASHQPVAGKEKNPNSSLHKDQKENSPLSRQSTVTQKRKSTYSSALAGCDTSIIVCWLETPDDIVEVPCESLLSVAENGYLIDGEDPSYINPTKCKDYAKYFISPMKNGLYRINLATSFGRQWLALPLIDDMTVSKSMLSSLIRESILNLCRRRRLDADSYQPPHVRRKLKIQEMCNDYKISYRFEPTEYYYNLFKSKTNS